MKRRWLGVLLVLLVLFIIPAVYTAEISTEIDDSVKVIVKLKDDVALEGTDANLNNKIKVKNAKVFSIEKKGLDEGELKRKFKSGFAAEVSRSGLEKLRNDPDVELVYPDRPVKIALTDSVPLINASAVTALTINGNNITGTGQTVCVIDTGINYTHTNLGGCTTSEFTSGSCSKVVGGYDFVNDDNDPYDDHGHGTHVSGIVAASGSILGVASDAKIVSIKALNSAGAGDSSDIIAAIEWCTNNATIYNISVISMSLGTATLFSSHCDSDDPTMAGAINDAIANNISVVVSTANDASSTGIALPSCIANATAVASTTKADEISSFSNTNSITDLLAPGSLITSAKMSGGSESKSGTSMAAPHVSGAFALLRQYRNEEGNVTITPEQAEGALISKGYNITDSRNSIVFPRIDVWSAVAEIEATNPLLIVDSPVNQSNLTNITVELNFTATDNIAVDTCVLTNSTGQNSTITCANTTFGGIRGYQNITVTIKDMAGNVNSTQIFFTVNLPPKLTLAEPSNKTYGNATPLSLAFVASDEDLNKIWYNIDNGENITITGNTTFKTNQSGHVLNLFANDTLNQVSNISVYFSVDVLGPNVTFVAPTPNNETFNSTNSVTINITTDENLSTAILWFDNINETMDGSGTNWYITKSNINEGNHTFRVHVNDTVNNTGISYFRFVTIDTTRNESGYFNQLNQTNADSNITIRLLSSSGDESFSNISVIINYTLEFNLSGTRVQLADFRWAEANTLGVVNVTTNVTTGNITANFSSVGAVLNKTVWVEMNSFLAENFTPAIIFDSVYRVFFYLNGSRQLPNSTRIAESCDAELTNRPCYSVGENNSTVYLLTFSGAAGGQDVENPKLNVISPTGATLGSTTVLLNYVATDNAAIDSCFYNLNSGGNTTIANCANTTINSIQGANTLSMYVNDTSGHLNQSNVNFTVTIASGGSSGGGGGGGGSSSKKSRASSLSVEEEEEKMFETAKVAEENLDTACSYTFDAARLNEISLVTQNSFQSEIIYTGDCEIPSVRLELSSDLEDDVDLSEYSFSNAGETIQFVIVRKGGIRNKLPSLITGSAIKDLTAFALDNLKATKTLTGHLALEGTVDEEIVFSSKFPFEVKVFTIENATRPMITFGGTFGLFTVLGTLVLFGYIRRRKRNKFMKEEILK